MNTTDLGLNAIEEKTEEIPKLERKETRSDRKKRLEAKRKLKPIEPVVEDELVQGEITTKVTFETDDIFTEIWTYYGTDEGHLTK